MALTGAWALTERSAFAASDGGSAAGDAQVAVELTGCNPGLASEVRRIVAVELRAALESARRADVEATRAIVSCRGDGASLSVSDVARARVLERTVPLEEAAISTRARLLALAVAELVAAIWEQGEPRSLAAAPLGRLETRPDEAPSRSDTESQFRWAVDAFADARTFAEAGSLWGGGVRADARLFGPLTLRFDVLADAGRVGRELGQVSIETFGGAVGVAWAAGVGPVALLPWVGVRAGAALLGGAPLDGAAGHKTAGAWAGPEIGLETIFFPSARLHAMLGISCGAATLGVLGRVTGESDVDVRGFWAAVVAGVGLASM